MRIWKMSVIVYRYGWFTDLLVPRSTDSRLQFPRKQSDIIRRELRIRILQKALPVEKFTGIPFKVWPRNQPAKGNSKELRNSRITLQHEFMNSIEVLCRCFLATDRRETIFLQTWRIPWNFFKLSIFESRYWAKTFVLGVVVLDKLIIRLWLTM